jgi:hypothetical protein
MTGIIDTLVTLDQIYALIPEDSTDYYLVADRKRKIVVIFNQKKELYEPTGEMVDGDSRISRLFRMEEGVTGLFREVDYATVRAEMKDFFLEKMNPADLAQEVVDTTPPGMLLEAHDRLKVPEVRKKARATTGCYAFVIPPSDPNAPEEHGKPMKLFVRG